MNPPIPLYLHIGFHKTGTTALQEFLLQNQQTLLTQGVLYPLVPLSGNGQQAYAYAINDVPMKRLGHAPDKGELRRQFLAAVEQAQPQKIIISSENFGGAREAKMAQGCKEFFAGFAVKVVVYVRRQDDYFCSVYQQRVKPPHSITYGIDQLNIDWELDYPERLQVWADQFGKDNILVRVYEKRQFVGGNIFQDFFQAVGVEFSDKLIPLKEQLNVSLNPKQTELLRQLNQAQPQHRLRLVEFIRQHFYNDEQHNKLDFMSWEDRARFYRRFAKSNQALAQTYLQRDQLFFDEVKFTKDYRPPQVTPDEVKAFTLTLWNAYIGQANGNQP